MIIFVQNPKKIWQIISKFNKVVEYKINIKKSIALLYTTPMAESEEELKEPLDEGERREWKSCLKTQHSKTRDHGICSHPITSWHTEGEKRETVTDFILLVSKIPEDSDCNHEIKRYLLFGRKAITNLDSIFKSRDISLPTKVHIIKAMFSPVVMYGCECWTIKVEHQKLMLSNCGVG